MFPADAIWLAMGLSMVGAVAGVVAAQQPAGRISGSVSSELYLSQDSDRDIQRTTVLV